MWKYEGSNLQMVVHFVLWVTEIICLISALQAYNKDNYPEASILMLCAIYAYLITNLKQRRTE